MKHINLLAFAGTALILSTSSLANGVGGDVLMVNDTIGSPSYQNITSWRLTESGFASATPINFTNPLNRKCVGVADFDNDGWTDSLWLNPSNNQLTIMYMVDGDHISSASIGNLPANSEMKGVLQQRHDGIAKVVYMNTANHNIYYMTVTNSVVTETKKEWGFSSKYNVIGVGSDPGLESIYLCVRRRTSNWVMVINSLGGPMYLTVPPNYFLVGVHDYNSDGFADFVWINKKNKNDMKIWLTDNSRVPVTPIRVRNANDYVPAGIGRFH